MVEGGFPKVAVPPIWDLNLVKELSIQAILISIVGFVESNAIGKTYATINGYEISANRELVAFGNSNIVSVCFSYRSNYLEIINEKIVVFWFFPRVWFTLSFWYCEHRWLQNPIGSSSLSK